MKFELTRQASNVLNLIKEKMTLNYSKGDFKPIKAKFTKKKYFLAVPIKEFSFPAFKLYINNHLFKSYLFKDNQWKEV